MTHCATGRLGLAALLLGGCDEAPVDPLDRDVVAEIARAMGDGQGNAHSGTWTVRIEQTDCDCPGELESTVCIPDALQLFSTSVSVTEGSGFLVMGGGLAGPTSNAYYEVSGAIGADGAFELGFVELALAIGVEISTVARLDGQFAEDGQSFEGTLQIRTRGSVQQDDLTCASVIELDGSR